MSNELTRVIDTITPEVFNAYMDQYSTEKSAIIQSGVAVPDERVSKMITAGGKMVTMPFWNDLNGDDEVVGDGDKELSTGKITSSSDTAAVLYRGRGWSVNEMAAVLSGSDPVRAVLNKIGNYWLRREQSILINTLNGVFSGPTAALKDHLNVTQAGIDGKAFLDTKQLLGDHADSLSLTVMHSAVYTELQKQQLIDFIPTAQADVKIPTYLGYRVVVDDALKPTAEGTYTTYLLAAGSFGRNTGTPSELTTFERERKAAAGTDNIYTRRAFVLKPYGVKWTDEAREDGYLTPTNTDLANAKNWKAVYDLKNIGIVGLQHTIGTSSAGGSGETGETGE
ncbi:major capsid protein [Lapidilactobacillus bayanensis]|uniref:major capsid protein n=1 Tax=Lapidilactobacillus bayanensis TaxID=2485998 RepID=UPI000F768ADC|nr:major capsid protein [Lapidilactobacillus bayanensis]